MTEIHVLILTGNYTVSSPPLGCACRLSPSLAHSGQRAAFLKGVAKHEQVVECHHIAGDDDYLLKVRCRNTGDLERFLTVALKERLGVARARTTIALTTVKETTTLPTKA